MKYYLYTPGSGNYGTDNNFTFSWSDDFAYWNTSRWDKATHTWVGNGCDFIPENAVIKDGYLILCLTDNVNIGYQDKTKPVLYSAKVHNGKILVNFSEELDEVSAQTKSNYIIYCVTIDSAKLLSDRKTVELTVSDWDLMTSKTLVVMNVKDDWSPANTISPKAVNIVLQEQFTFPLKINCGGNAVLGYKADQQWGLTTDYGYLDGGDATYSFSINNTDEDEIYQSERWGSTTYRVRLPEGTYRVKLMFAENYHTQADRRIFDVWVEQQRVIQNLDIFSVAGRNTAYVVEVNNVQVNDGYLDIYFVTHSDYPLINGIVIDMISLGVDESSIQKKFFNLNQNFPNPFNGQTTISYEIYKPDYYSLIIYDSLGRKLLKKNLGYLFEGNYAIKFDPKNSLNYNLSSGIYFYTLINSSTFQSKKMMLLN